jgi:[glutamine synthetase] adenylyltransferase / [glutamine synthetase]-adenylyl-L-tyrosine phosphorylase
MVDLSSVKKNDISACLATAARLSRYVKRLLDAEPALASEVALHLDQPFSRHEMAGFLQIAAKTTEAELHSALRNLRKRMMLRLITRDLNGWADLAEVVETATALAEITLNLALETCHGWLRAEYGDATDAQGHALPLLIVGMGKLGGGELNVSSDIDLVFAYPEDGMTNGPRSIDNHQYFILLGKQVIRALNDITADGFVFRVDMRLRPYGDSGSLVSSFAMLEEYFFTQARPWERYAWLKGRVVCGSDQPIAQALDALVKPFVYRRYLDYGAIADLREVHGQIRRAAAQKDAANNIKIGPGGIREIEFIAQVFQLIRGGRERDLQLRPTLATLALLGSRKLLPDGVSSQLIDYYQFLRNLEHRLQYLDDAQTQIIPTNEADRALIAESMDFATYDAFNTELNRIRAEVSKHFNAVFSSDKQLKSPGKLDNLWQDGAPGETTEEGAAKQLTELGYADPALLLQRLRQMRESSHYSRLPEASRARLDLLVPRLIEAASKQPQPDATLKRLLDFTEAIDRRAAYLALLGEHSEILTRLAKLMGASSWAADYLRQHPILLDELLDTSELHTAPDWPALKQKIRVDLEQEPDAEHRMDKLRHFKHTQTFRLLAQDLEGLMTLETLSDHITELADIVLDLALESCWRELLAKTDDPSPPLHFCIIGYGKLGGKELGYASDLDMIFLYEDDTPGAGELYATLARRIINWLSAYTAAGMLYETDLRLRPDGVSGLLVSSFNGYEDYQRHRAWVWEHQALTRARYVAGDKTLGGKFEALRKSILMQARDAETLKKEIIAMREKMHATHHESADIFDIKHSRGGIVDVEFMVQYLVLAHAREHETLTLNKGNIALLKRCGELGLIPADLALQCADAYREFRRLQHASRLNNETTAMFKPVIVANHIKSAQQLWQWLFE